MGDYDVRKIEVAIIVEYSAGKSFIICFHHYNPISVKTIIEEEKKLCWLFNCPSHAGCMQ